ncbi:hypothetical protein GF407_16785 [candidate division KSB1 bacterium]|nr:hypothetical protein [candidate division KSB1 bacterium]
MREKKSIMDRKVYIPQMSYISARCMAAAFQSVGIDAQPSPTGDAETYELARKYLSGDECLPESITLGNFLKITEQADYDPDNVAFMMPTSNGPCRFGHYRPLIENIFKERKEPVLFVSPSSSDGYGDLGKNANRLFRTAWCSIVVADILRKLLLKTRPYELEKGKTDRVYKRSLDRLCDILAQQDVSHKRRVGNLVEELENTLKRFQCIPVNNKVYKPLIGIVGEIFCRLNDFSNSYLIRQIEDHGGEVWLSDITEWVWYTCNEEKYHLRRLGKQVSLKMFGATIRHAVMHRDEQKLLKPFRQEFRGYEEPDDIAELLDNSYPYLPREGSHGEMVVNVGRAVWYYKKGAAGVIDISPFTCMNGIVCESVYPRLSHDLNGFPIRIFYFDGLQTDWGSDVEIFLELAKQYMEQKKSPATRVTEH